MKNINYFGRRFYFIVLLMIFILSNKSFVSNAQAPEMEILPDIEMMSLAIEEVADSLSIDSIPQVVAMDPEELFNNMGAPDFKPTLLNLSMIPKVFHGYRHTYRQPYNFSQPNLYEGLAITSNDSISQEIEFAEGELMEIMWEPSEDFGEDLIELQQENLDESPVIYDVMIEGKMQKWLRDALMSNKIQEDFAYNYMIENPMTIEYAYWDLPVPPQLIEDDVTFISYIKRLRLPDIDLDKAVIPETEIRKKFWLHTLNTALQFSQAFVSPNWYQGGNDYLSLLFNFNWNVQLNPVYHPNLLFQSNLAYKLAMSSNQKGSLHKYKIAEDVFQYNLNAGVKAFKKWYYSFNLLFKTQLLNNYEEDTMVRTASFLSPGDLNMGLGMSYSYQNKLKTMQFTLTISPLSYNLKTCISDKVDHATFNISPNRKVKNEIGSNTEFNMAWNITSNISYKTRLFLFTDYSYFLSDWENTFSFEINKFLSTQLYLHLRYDTSAEKNTSWKTFMMREILSFGLSYTFSTKP